MFTMRNLVILSCALMLLICSKLHAQSPFVIEIVSGNNQTAKIGQQLPHPLVVSVYWNLLGQQVNLSNQAISFSVSKQPSNAGATVNPMTNHTGENGQTSTNLTLGNTPGTYTSEVSSFSFRHRILLSSRWILYHNLVLESGPNFRWQYSVFAVQSN